MSHPLESLKSNPFVLAPMAAITDCAFRTFMREQGCGVVISELVSAVGILYRSPKTLQLMAYEPVQRPVGIQLFGETPEALAQAAKVVEEQGADFVDLNFGCPVPKVVKKGGGSAILKELPKVEAVFKAVRAATQLPVTVKIRTGWDEKMRNAVEVANIAYNEGVTWVAIHGRTRAQGYSGLADWDFIAEVKAKSKIPVLGNGDIVSASQAVRRLKETGVDGIMIGRGCLKNPWIFAEANQLLRSGAMDMAPRRDFVQMFQTLQEGIAARSDERITLLQVRKFASWFASGYPGASRFRKAIFSAQSVDETMSQTLEYFAGLREIMQADTSQEAFLMGGHG